MAAVQLAVVVGSARPHMHIMPIRAHSHILEEQSVRRFGDALPSGWVYRGKAPDYGIDGEVEVFYSDGSSSGLTFNVQLRATDDAAKVDRVRLEVDELEYYRSLEVPTLVVRYGRPNDSFYWQWASNISSRVDISEGQKTVTYRFGDDERWTDATADTVLRTLTVRRQLISYPPSMAVPLRIDLSAIQVTGRYSLDRALARAISDSHGALTRASKPADVEAFARLEPNFLAVGIDTLSGVTFDLKDPTADDYIAAILYALVRLFRRQRLLRQAEAIALLITERGIACPNQELAYDACIALARDLPTLVALAIINGFHDQGPMHPLIALTIAKAPQDEKARQTAMTTFFDASLAAAREVGLSSQAAVHYSIGNFYRHRRDLVLAAYHYNRARHLRPAYLNAGYFLNELAGVLFLAGHFQLAQRFYREVVRLDPDDPSLAFLLGDALLHSGAISEARASFEVVLIQCGVSRLLREAALKVMVCDYLSVDFVPRQRSEASSKLRADGGDNSEHLEHVLCNVDAMHPLARFNLGIARDREGNRFAALHHFLICAFVQPHDIAAWVNAAICALGLGDVGLLQNIVGTAIDHMGADAYDQFRADIEGQGMAPDDLTALDLMAMQFLEESERAGGDSFILRMLDGDGYQTMEIFGLGKA